MRAELLEILRCPVCRSSLELERRDSAGPEVVDGTLTCERCGATYPISDGIPDLMPPDERD